MTKSNGKTIKLFLIDGDPNGRLQCELSNWTGKAYRIPRTWVNRSDDRSDLDNTGVYILFGYSEAENREIAYIGEADGIRKRLCQHLKKKEFWNDALVFVSKDDNLNKAHIKYMESRLYEMAVETGRYRLDNSSVPTRASISEADLAEMEEFIENLRIMVNALGFKIFESIRNVNPSQETEQAKTFYIQTGKGANASGQRTSEGFVVLKGSIIADPPALSFPTGLIRLREELIKNKIVEDLVFTKDYLFSSPSNAASFITGRSTNGLIEWRSENGVSLKIIE